MENEVLVSIGKEKYTTQIKFNNHAMLVDEPTDVGGQDLGPKPLLLLLSSLGSCKAITMRMYADNKKWPLEAIEITLSSESLKGELGQSTKIQVQVNLIGDLDEAQKTRILAIGEKCPIQKILNNPIHIETNLIQ